MKGAEASGFPVGAGDRPDEPDPAPAAEYADLGLRSGPAEVAFVAKYVRS